MLALEHGAPEVFLPDDFRFAVHPLALTGIVIRLAADGLLDDARHWLGHTKNRARTTPTHSAAQSKKPDANRVLRRQRKILAGDNQVRISPLGGKLGLAA
jgi:hypothetical protein